MPPWALKRTGQCLSPQEDELARLINEYRVENDLSPVDVTHSLTMVAQWHVADLHANHPHNDDCNLHSWSSNGPWSAVCYTPDHANRSEMWNKPREITANVYPGNGFENAFGGGDGSQATAQVAFKSWKKSSPHNAVFLEQGKWNGKNWSAMGVGLHEGYAAVWFGDESDPQGVILPCTS